LIYLYSRHLFFLIIVQPPTSTLFPYTTLFRSLRSSEREVSRRSIRYPNSWDLGIAFYYLAMTKSQLSEISPKENQIEYLRGAVRSEEHTSELQSPDHLVCRLLLEKKNKKHKTQ